MVKEKSKTVSSEKPVTIEGSVAMAETAANCNVEVVACFPITPSTHIAEHLDQLYAEGKIPSFIAVESELSAISALIGGAAAGARTFSATSSQGLLLMHEGLHNAAGMRLPIVMAVAARAISAPLNIWGDWSDVMAQRDTGWLQIHCESNQEACDTMPQAYKAAEAAGLPCMVIVDGFFLTHAVEQIIIPPKEQVAEYLPKFNPDVKLDPAKPLTLGAYATPAFYQEFRQDFSQDADAAGKFVKLAHDDWAKLTGRAYGNGLWEEYGPDKASGRSASGPGRLADADIVLVSMGSVCGNIKEVIDRLNASKAGGKRYGLLRVRAFRPFSYEIGKLLAGKQAVGVLEKSAGFGAKAPLHSDVYLAMAAAGGSGSSTAPAREPVSFVGGLGGRDVPEATVEKMLSSLSKDSTPRTEWV